MTRDSSQEGQRPVTGGRWERVGVGGRAVPLVLAELWVGFVTLSLILSDTRLPGAGA